MKEVFLQCNAMWTDAPRSACKNAKVTYKPRTLARPRFKIHERLISGDAYFQADLERLQAS